MPFSKDARPAAAGSYFDFIVSTPPTILPAVGKTVCVGFTHNWGPFKTPVLLNSWQDFLTTFKPDLTPGNQSPGYLAVKGAFFGEGVPGYAGAGAVLAYRHGGSAAAKATRTLQNTTPAVAITLTAKYEGARGNNLKVTTQDYANDSLKNQLLVYDGTTLVETYTYLDADIAGLATQINASSQWMTAVANINAVALGVVSSQAFAGGNDGSTLVVGDYTATLAALESQRFGVLTFDNLSDTTIMAAIKTWALTQMAKRRFFMQFCGALDEVYATAAPRSTTTLNDENILNIGIGSVYDDSEKDAAGAPLVLSTAQLAPRIAGILANRGERMSMTFAKLAGLRIKVGPSASDVANAYDNGLIVLTRSSDVNATVRIEKGLSTYVVTTDPVKPKAVYSVPKFVATMHGIENELRLWFDDVIIGKTTVDADTRGAVLGKIQEFCRIKEDLNSIQPGWKALVDPVPPASDDDSFVAFVIAAKFGRSTEQVYLQGQLG